MQHPDYEGKDEVRGTVGQAHERAGADASDDGEGTGHRTPRDPSSIELVRRIVVGLFEAIGEGAELVGASVGEALARSRLDLERRVVILLLVSWGVLLLSVGIIFLMREIIGNWYATLLVVGVVHIGIGLWLSRRWRREEDDV